MKNKHDESASEIAAVVMRSLLDKVGLDNFIRGLCITFDCETLAPSYTLETILLDFSEEQVAEIDVFIKGMHKLNRKLTYNEHKNQNQRA